MYYNCGLQIRTSLPHGLQIPADKETDGAARAESKLAYAMPSKEEEDDSQIPADNNKQQCRIVVIIHDTASLIFISLYY